MESYRLKNIAIVILLLLNAFLLLLLGYQHYQARAAAAETAEQLRTLFADNQLTLSPEADLQQAPLRPLDLVRHADKEEAMAAFLLGGSVTATSQGGGIYSYQNGSGSVQFRSGGSFEGGRPDQPIADPAGFVRDFCDAFGYQELKLDLSADQTGSASAVQYVAGVLIDGCAVTMTFDRGLLTSVTGSHISLEDAAAMAGEQLTAVTALVRFLDYRSAEGIVCSRVEDLRCVYVLQSAASTLRLLPAWQVVTDTYTYFVDCATGDISRQ